jgi:hypothetical protein
MNAALSSSLSSSVLRMLSAIASMLVERSSSARYGARASRRERDGIYSAATMSSRKIRVSSSSKPSPSAMERRLITSTDGLTSLPVRGS